MRICIFLLVLAFSSVCYAETVTVIDQDGDVSFYFVEKSVYGGDATVIDQNGEVSFVIGDQDSSYTDYGNQDGYGE